MGGGSYSADTLPVDDDTFLNGGLPPEPPTSKPAPAFVPGEAKIVKKDMLSTNDSAPKNEPVISKGTSSIDSTEEPPKDASDEAPVTAPAQVPKTPEAIENNEEKVVSKEVTIQPSATFEEEMKETPPVNSSSPAGASGNAIGQPYRPQQERSTPQHHQMSHVAGIIPSQSMIPDGMLADNRISLDGEDAPEEHKDTMIPSQAMAETFTVQQTDLTTLHATATGLPPEEDETEDVEEIIDDDEPIVVGPVISSAGMESLSDQHAEDPTATLHATTMKIEAPIDESEIPDSVKDEAPAVAKPAEEKPVEAPAPVETPATPAAPTSVETTAAATTATPTEPAAQAAPEAPKAEEPTLVAEKPTEAPVEPAAETKPEAPAAPEVPKTEEPKTEPAPMQYTSTTEPVKVPPYNNIPGGNGQKKSSSTPIIFFAILGILLIIGGVIAGIAIFGGGNSEPEEEPVVAAKKTFFLPNEDGQYALFNEDGERLTDFLYTRDNGAAPYFSYYEDKASNGGTTIVYDKDKKVGIINTSGELIVKPGEYDSISGSGYYSATKGDDKYILTMDGTVFNKDGAKVIAQGYDSFALLEGDVANIYVSTGAENSYKKATSIACAEHKDVCREKGISTYYFGSLTKKPKSKTGLSLYYEGATHLLDINDNKEVLSFESDALYHLDDVFIKEGEYYFDSYYNGAYRVKFFKDGKEEALDRNCYSIERATVNGKETAFCHVSGEGTYWINGNKTSVKLTKKRTYISETTYADIPDSSKIAFYENGSLVKTIEGSFEFKYDVSYYDDTNMPYITSDRTSSNGVYVLKRQLSNEERQEKGYPYEWILYNAKGEQLGDSYISIDNFDYTNYELAIARSFDDEMFIINKNGKIVSKTYKGTLTNNYSHYIVNAQSSSYILDKEGKEIFKTTDGKIKSTLNHDDSVYYILNNKNTFSLYALNGDKVFSVDGAKDMKSESYYFEVEKTSGAKEYYTFSGKKFHEVKKKKDE